MRTFIIKEEPEELLTLQVSRSPYDPDAVFLRRSAGTMTLGASEALRLVEALQAVLSGEYDRAVTETTIRLENEDQAWRAANRAKHEPGPSKLKTLNLADLGL